MTTSRKIAISLPNLGDEEWQSLREPIKTGWVTQGPRVAAFEMLFSERHKVEHSIAVSSCTTGLHLILSAMGIGPGDEVIVPAFTWVATANVVLHCGAKPVFVDVDTDTFNIDANQLAAKLTDKTKAVIVVHLFGLCADVDAVRSVIPDHVKIIEDAACAIGSEYKSKKAGSLGDAAAFSFHPRKIITTGEGGMITTNDDDLAHQMREMRNHGATVSEEERHNGPKPYILPEFNLLGFNYRMTDLQGAIGFVQLSKLKGFLEERTEWAGWYMSQLSEIEWLQLPHQPDNGKHGWQAFVTTVDPEKAPYPRNEIMEKMQAQGISTRPGTHAVHMLNLYKKLYGMQADDYPRAKYCNDNSMAIPLHNRMTREDYDYVVKVIKGL